MPESRLGGTKRNLVPPLRALQSARASSADYALSAELRLALRYSQFKFYYEQTKTHINLRSANH